jgi:hypothetical protein
MSDIDVSKRTVDRHSEDPEAHRTDEEVRNVVDGQVDAQDADTVDGQEAADLGKSDAEIREQALALEFIGV